MYVKVNNTKLSFLVALLRTFLHELVRNSIVNAVKVGRRVPHFTVKILTLSSWEFTSFTAMKKKNMEDK